MTASSADRNGYRTSARYEMDPRRLALSGGPLDGRTWTGVVAVGSRVFCGEGTWATEGVYLVTAKETVDEDGRTANVAIPAFG